ncbi:Gag-Pol polyprotein, partial [Mucuna pruriens]
MHMNLSRPATNVKRQEWPSTEGMECPNSQCYFVKFFMYGSPRETLTFYLLLIMFQDGWRLRPPELMMLKFGVSKVLISDQGIHFCNRTMGTLLEKYGLVCRVAIAYHPQFNGQAKVFNREIKKLLQKMANPSQNDWSRLLEETLWAHRTTYQTPLGMSPYQIVFGKACHLPVEIEHRAYWAIKKCNMAYDQAGQERKL